jgi:hypothetical protein
MALRDRFKEKVQRVEQPDRGQHRGQCGEKHSRGRNILAEFGQRMFVGAGEIHNQLDGRVEEFRREYHRRCEHNDGPLQGI